MSRVAMERTFQKDGIMSAETLRGVGGTGFLCLRDHNVAMAGGH